MKHRFASITLFCTLILVSAALTGCPSTAPTWRYTLGASDYSAHALLSPDGGHFIVGAARLSSQELGFYSRPLIARLSSSGKLDWRQFFHIRSGATGAVTPSGDLLAAMSVGTSYADFQLHVLKFAPDGTIARDLAYGLQGDGHLYPTSAVSTNDGGCVVAGSSQSGGVTHPFLLKLDPQGGVTWERHLLGEAADTIASRLIAVGDAGFALTGTTSANKGRLLRLDAEGNLLWLRHYDQVLASSNFPVAIAKDGGFILAGVKPAVIGSVPEPELLRTDADGRVVSTTIYQGDAFRLGPFLRGYTVTDMVADEEGRVVLSGHDYFYWDWFPLLTGLTYANGYLLHFDANNEVAAYKELGRDVFVLGLSTTPSGGYIGVGEDGLELVVFKGTIAIPPTPRPERP